MINKYKYAVCLAFIGLCVVLSGCRKNQSDITPGLIQQTESTEIKDDGANNREDSKMADTAINQTEVNEENKKMMAEGVVSEQKPETDNESETLEIEGKTISIYFPFGINKKKENVEYGELIHTSYYSTTCEKDRNVNILLPAGYSDEKKYPVLYVLHGIFGDEYSMVGDESEGIPFTVGNMIKEGNAKEMIVVFPFMYASKTKDQCTAIDDENVLAYDNFVNDLVNDLMPFMEANYSIKTGKENTAITGFSMGGRESLAIGFLKPELFGYVGSISAAPGLIPGKDWAITHPGQFKEDELKYGDEKPMLIMVCCGDDDKVVGTFPKTYHELFIKNEVDHIWWEIPGSDHGDPAITSGVYNFVKELF